ncbi:MAG: flavin reductase family protein [Clostridia bacterium]
MEYQDFYAFIPEAARQMEKGVFLMTEGAHNPMTVGWAQFGYVWGKPMVTVFVRKSRYTYSLIEKSKTFSISVPKAGNLSNALGYCGSHSGRDGDKCAAAGLSVLPARTDCADGIADCAIHFECRIVFRQEMDLTKMDTELATKFYGSNQAFGNGDPHTLYFGEVIAAYRE